MTPRRMAEIHAASFEMPRPWTAREFAALARAAGVFPCLSADGFAWGRAIADEAELLTLAVDPSARRSGQGRALLADVLSTAAARGATRVFLEVAADNAPALALYAGQGFTQAGRRKGYYARSGGAAVDALLLTRAVA